MNRLYRIALLFISVLIPHILGGAVCSQALDIPIIVKGTLPNEYSKAPFELNLDEKLKNAGVVSADGKIPQGAPKALELVHTDAFDLTKKPEFKQYRSRIHTAYINHVSIEVKKNSLNVHTPQLDISVAALSATKKADKAPFTKVAELPPIAKGIIGTPADLIWIEKEYPRANYYLQKYILGLRINTQLKLTPGAPMPKGIIKLNIHFQATFVLKAL